MNERSELLGFVPQKEIIYNKFLPYAKLLDSESQAYLAEIKANLGKSILYHNLEDVGEWISHLARYVRHYGRKFSKEDHINFIKLLFEIVIIPDIDLGSTYMQKAITCLTTLLKKCHLLSRDDLVLPWRPLYELYERTLFSSYETDWLFSVPCNFENMLKHLIRVCRPYFSIDSTQEILQELRPLMCPFDTVMNTAMLYSELFLCTALPPSEHHKGFKLWFDEYIGIWKASNNNPPWEGHLFWLLSHLAKDNVGCIDWEPILPLIFTKLLRSFCLPGMSDSSRTNAAVDITPFINIIVYSIGPSSTCQLHLDRLFKALESYYHPSNNGRWMVKLHKLLHSIAAAFVKRLHRERYMTSSWKDYIPEDYKLIDEDITCFVQSLRPAAMLSMFSKRGCSDAIVALQNLANLRPELVIPAMVERLYSSLETLTEPHRLTASLYCVGGVQRLLAEKHKYFPESRSHVIPLLMGTLPGIDPNDFKKSMVTLHFISNFVTSLLLVDCSNAVNTCPELTEQQQELCLATAAFEDFVLQFMDRCFALIENSTLDNSRHIDHDTQQLSQEEAFTDVALYTVFFNILIQCSPSIYKAALSKLQTFVTSHIFEVKVSGRYASDLCRSACKANPELGLQAFVPHFSKLILALTDSGDVLREEKLDDELLFSLLVLSEVVLCDGRAVLKYHQNIVKVLERTLHLKCVDGYQMATSLMCHVLKAYTTIYPLNRCSIADPWNRYGPEEMHNYIEDWGRPGDMNNLDATFHETSDEELSASQSLLENFLLPELERLQLWASRKKILTREEVLCSLTIVLDSLSGAAAALPMWPEEHICVRDSSISKYYYQVVECGLRDINVQGGQNVRLLIYDTVRQVMNYICEFCEDDTKSLNCIIKIYKHLVFSWGKSRNELDTRWKLFRLIKKSLENKLRGRKQHSRCILIDRIYLQHELRVSARYVGLFTEKHVILMKDLLRLSVSHYTEIRVQAQYALNLYADFDSGYKLMSDEITELLKKDPVLCHEEFKGTLHVVLGNKASTLLSVRDWGFVNHLWPLLVASKHSEKPSIVKILDSISKNLHKTFCTMQIKIELPQSILEVAKCLWNDDNKPLPSSSCPSDAEISEGAKTLALRGETNERHYLALIHELVELIKSGTLHWRHYHMAFHMLLALSRYDVRFPKEGVELFVSHLTHDTLIVRKFALLATVATLRQQKRNPQKIEVEPTNLNSNKSLHPVLANLSDPKRSRTNGIQYNSTALPDTQEEWESRHFVHKTHIGFYTWPEPLKIHAKDTELPNLDRKREELAEEEIPIYDAFSQQSFVDTLLSFYSLEERKSLDKLDCRRTRLFKSLFFNFGDTFLPQFLGHLKTMAVNPQESTQRAAIEVLAGLLSGCKHWGFHKMHSLKEKITPIIKLLINNVTVETLNDWCCCLTSVSQSRDPNKFYWLLEIFMEEPAKSDSGSFLEAGWFYMLTCVVSEMEWRAFELLHRILVNIEPKLSHSYQNVRQKIGSLLNTIFLYDIPLDIDSLSLSPRRAPFIKAQLPKLAILETIKREEKGENNIQNDRMTSVIDSAATKDARNLFRTLCHWIMCSCTTSLYSAPPEIFQLLPLLCLMQSDTVDDGLNKECSQAISCLGQSVLSQSSIEAAISTLKEVVSSKYWHSRRTAISFIQVMVFSNLFTVMKNEAWVNEIHNMVLTLLQDERVEVREAAGATLGGLIHCEFIKITDELIDMFKVKSKKKLKRKLATQNCVKSIEPEDIIERHSGVLGLCACVNAFPYDVPEFLPDILVLLGDHLHDPQPIETTIKKTLSSFRRTHHDNWRDHKLKFTDDQLVVITDLLVSPSYYA